MIDRPVGASFSSHHSDMEPNPQTTAAPTRDEDRRPRAGVRTRAPSSGAFERRGGGRIRAAGVLALCGVLTAGGLFFGGFLAFAGVVGRLATPPDLRADGIVVLTGGAERIAGAMDLLRDGRAQRLLISGVHPQTSARQIGLLVDAGPSIFDCCIDLDRQAANTIGNAVETAKWVRDHRFGSIIVVTSAYHMPRSLAELGHAMPEVELVPYPVARPTLELERWWLNPRTARLLLEEYLKYMASQARLTLHGDGSPSVLAGAIR